jgi:type IV pilus assembly protein PilY1
MNRERTIAKSLKRALVYALIAGQALPVARGTDISDVPLITANQAKPNIMFMLDNSGSMSNVVPDTASGYNASVTYLASCPAATLVAAGTSVDLVISSSTAKIRIGGTSYNFGTGTGQKCFDSTALYGARLLADSGGAPSGYLDADYRGNYLNWYFGAGWGTITSGTTRRPGTKTRMEIAKDVGKQVIDNLQDARAGLSTYNGGNGGALVGEIKDLDTTSKTTLKGSIDALTPSGATPLAETLSDIGRYFTRGYTGNLTLHPGQPNQSTASVANVFNNTQLSGATITADPVQYGCQLNFAVLLTDGRPQDDQNISTHLRDYTGDCAVAGACGTFGQKPAPRSYESLGSDYLDDVAAALYDMDLRPNLPDPRGAAGLKKRNLTTYAIGFADEQAKNDPLLQQAAAKGGGLFLGADDAAGLITAFDDVLADIYGKGSASAAVAVSNVNVTATNNDSFATQFTSGSWTGDLVSSKIDLLTGLPQAAQTWSAADQLKALTNPAATRKIASYSGSAGIQFQPTSATTATKLSATQQALLNTPTKTDGADVVAYLRGDSSKETGTILVPAVYRNRISLLGDMVNAEPVFVGQPQVKWFGESGFAAHVTALNTRSGVVYQGANDGMLHAFSAQTGDELWAYVPNLVLGTLNKYSRRGWFPTYLLR